MGIVTQKKEKFETASLSLAIQTLQGVSGGERSRFGIGKPSNRGAKVNGPMRRIFLGRAYQVGRFKETTKRVNRSQGDYLPLTGQAGIAVGGQG